MQHRIKIVGAMEIDGALIDSQDFSIALKRCGIKSITKHSNTDDGEPQYTYALESLDQVTVIGAGAKILQGQGKSRSKQLRARLYTLALAEDKDPETFYQEKMNYIISNIEEILKIWN